MNISKRMTENKNSCKKVLDTELNIIHNSVREASQFINISASYLTQQLSGKRNNKTKYRYL